jgi:hypothetical protein
MPKKNLKVTLDHIKIQVQSNLLLVQLHFLHLLGLHPPPQLSMLIKLQHVNKASKTKLDVWTLQQHCYSMLQLQNQTTKQWTNCAQVAKHSTAEYQLCFSLTIFISSSNSLSLWCPAHGYLHFTATCCLYFQNKWWQQPVSASTDNYRQDYTISHPIKS